jgi:DNA repair protein RadC
MNKVWASSTVVTLGSDLGHLAEAMASIRQIYMRGRRLRQCLEKAGPENLPDYELLQLMLFTIKPRANVDTVVEELLERFGDLAEVLSADTEALAAAGLSSPEIAGMKFIREVALRFMRVELHQRPVIGSWDTLIDYCNAQLAYSSVEEFHVLFLDRKNALIKDERLQRGTIDHTPVYPREVIKRALELAASAIILVHNHPSGDPTPSVTDITVTKAIIKAAVPLGVTVYDHLIIGRGRHTSLRDLGLMVRAHREVAGSRPSNSALHDDNLRATE